MQKEGEKKNKQVIKIRFLECRVVKLLILKNTGYLLGISPMPSKFSVKYKQETEMGILWRKENYKKLTEVPFIFLSLRNNQWTSLGYTWIISIICFGSKILKENCIRWKKKKRNITSGHSISVTKADDSDTQIMNSFGLCSISFVGFKGILFATCTWM